jgi:hypothetical protein
MLVSNFFNCSQRYKVQVDKMRQRWKIEDISNQKLLNRLPDQNLHRTFLGLLGISSLFSVLVSFRFFFGAWKVDCNEDGWQLDTSFTSVHFSLFCSTSIHDKTTSLLCFSTISFFFFFGHQTLSIFIDSQSNSILLFNFYLFWSFYIMQRVVEEEVASWMEHHVSILCYPFNGDYLSGKIGKSSTNETESQLSEEVEWVWERIENCV